MRFRRLPRITSSTRANSRPCGPRLVQAVWANLVLFLSVSRHAVGVLTSRPLCWTLRLPSSATLVKKAFLKAAFSTLTEVLLQSSWWHPVCILQLSGVQHVDRQTSTEPALYVCGRLHPHRDPGRTRDCSHSHGHFSKHQHSGGQRHLDL